MRSGVAGGLHPFTWTLWLGAVAAVIALTRNPLYLLLLLLGLAVMLERLRLAGRMTPLDPLAFTAVAVAFGGGFNALTTRYGTTVIARLPEHLPLIGGPITAEALVYGMISGLVLGTLVAAFAVFGGALPVGALLSLAPRAFYPLAVVITIAVTYVPVTMRYARQVREAQQLRGHRLRTWRDALPLVLPLLIGGLERALQLAEALAARGFAADPPPPAVRMFLAGGLATIFAGLLVRFAWGFAAWGWLLLACGVGLVGAALVVAGRRIPRTHYRRYGWRMHDAVVLAGAGLALAALLLPWNARTSIGFMPYPTLQPPAFAPLLALAYGGLLAPAGFKMDAAMTARDDQERERPEVYR